MKPNTQYRKIFPELSNSQIRSYQQLINLLQSQDNQLTTILPNLERDSCIRLTAIIMLLFIAKITNHPKSLYLDSNNFNTTETHSILLKRNQLSSVPTFIFAITYFLNPLVIPVVAKLWQDQRKFSQSNYMLRTSLIFFLTQIFQVGAMVNKTDRSSKTTAIQITSCVQLQNINQNLQGAYELANDIDCKDSKTWNNGAGFKPIGTFNSFFEGSFNGSGYNICNLYINRPSQRYIGIFGATLDATVTNVGLVDINLTGKSYSGGLIGFSKESTVKYSFSQGSINAQTGFCVGGLIGYQSGGTILNSHFEGAVKGIYSVGGLAGVADGVVSNAYASGQVVGVGNAVGGLIGETRGNLSSCYATTNVTTGAGALGGLAGNNLGVITNAFAIGSVVATNPDANQLVGGLVGANMGSILYAYSIGAVKGNSGLYNSMGGLVGSNNEKIATVVDSYYDLSTSGQNDTGKGTPKTTLQMRRYQTFSNWSFGHSWKIQQDCDYPFLSWQNQNFAIEFTKISSPQRVNTLFPVSLHTNNKRQFNASITFFSERGQVFPLSATLINGEWSGSMMLYDVGKANQLGVRWFSEDGFCSGIYLSNFFDIVEQDGQLANNATIIGTVVEDDGTAIANATVTVFVGHPSYGGKTLGISMTTDEHGYYEAQKLIPTNFYLKVQKKGYQTSISKVETAMNRNVTGNAILTRACPYQASIGPKIPVLLVPGIMGSTKKDNIGPIPELPKYPPKYDSGELKLLDPPFRNIFGLVGWQALRKELKNYHFCQKMIVNVPYDWSLSIQQIRDQYLIPSINKAKQKNNSNRVIIVAHSMGGLVARSYIQSNQYQNDIDFLVLVATPNKGSDNVYFIWEGGDPIRTDKLIKPPIYYPYKFFYSETLNRLWGIRGKKDEHAPNKLCDIRNRECDNLAVYNFVHNVVPSAGQLIPTYHDALIDNKTGKSRKLIFEENTLLKAMNNQTCLSDQRGRCLDANGEPYQFKSPAEMLSNAPDLNKTVETILFYGLGEDRTVSQIRVGPSDPTRIIYKDGVESKTTRTTGDGTVIPNSVIFNDYFPQGKKLTAFPKIDAEHTNIIRKSVWEIAFFVACRSIRTKPTLKPDITSEVDNVIDVTPLLAVTIDGRVQIRATNARNLSVSEMMTLEQSQVVITNVTKATYIFSLTSLYQEDYTLNIIYYLGNGTVTMMESVGYYDNSLNYIELAVDPFNLTTPLKYDRAFETPTDLKMYNNSNQLVTLSWQDVAGDTIKDVINYAVYYRPYYDPYFHFLGESRSNEKTFEMNLTWEEAESNTYRIRSILKNNRSTFFSKPSLAGKPANTCKGNDSASDDWKIIVGVLGAVAMTLFIVYLIKFKCQRFLNRRRNFRYNLVGLGIQTVSQENMESEQYESDPHVDNKINSR